MESEGYKFDCLTPYFLHFAMCTLQHVHFATHGLCNTCTWQLLHFAQPVHFATCALCNMCTLQIIMCLMDQLYGSDKWSASQTSWKDQFSLFKSLDSLHIRRWTFQFVHCCSVRIRQRPCFLNTLYKNTQLDIQVPKKINEISL